MNTVGVFGGLVVGSAVGGLLAQAFGVTAPFWFAFAGSAVFLVLIWRQLRHIAHSDESRSRRGRVTGYSPRVEWLERHAAHASRGVGRAPSPTRQRR